MNFYKTKNVRNRSIENLKVYNIEIGRVVEYTYLGRILSVEQRPHNELLERKRRAWKGYWATKHIFKGKM